MANKLSLYNSALLLIGEKRLATLTDTVESRRTLDDHYDDVVASCLSAGLWNFAKRAIEANADPSVTPTFGFQYAFRKPNDLLRVDGVFRDSGEADAETRYRFEQEYFYADLTPIYIRYISTDPQYGLNLGKWTAPFRDYVEASLAAKIAPRITNNMQKAEEMRKLSRDLLLSAENMNAMDQPARFPPMGSWARSRLYSGFRGSRLGGTGRGL